MYTGLMNTYSCSECFGPLFVHSGGLICPWSHGNTDAQYVVPNYLIDPEDYHLQCQDPDLYGAPAVLYRAFDEENILLYVGVTGNLAQRQSTHRNNSPWCDETIRWEVENYPTRLAALGAETKAIQMEKPIYNVAHNRKVDNV